jgi:hypothetical protein
MNFDFKDIRDELPNHDDIVIFVSNQSGNFLIYSGIFKINKELNFWLFESLEEDRNFEKGTVFKWALMPQFAIESAEYPEGKPVPLKYCKHSYTKFEDRFFTMKVTSMPAFLEQKELEKAKERMLLNRFCKCGEKAIAPKLIKTTVKIDYPISYTQWLCKKCEDIL